MNASSLLVICLIAHAVNLILGQVASHRLIDGSHGLNDPSVGNIFAFEIMRKNHLRSAFRKLNGDLVLDRI